MLARPAPEDREISKRAMLFLSLAVIVIVASPILLSQRNEPSATRSFEGEDDYPEAWRTTLESARSTVTFEFVLPDLPEASATNISEVFAAPEGHAIAIRFPAQPLIGKDPVRQDFIEIFETPWLGGDPAVAWAEDVENSGILGESVIEVGGLPALAVTPRSTTDIERANPAFLRFVFEGIDVQISGGDEIDRLIEIANSMIVQDISG